ncbi:MAG: cupin domain-containing protein [Chloroflexota bacterium]|nr:cupin domain-containing protein [Chloroflexota bacterium]
MDIRRFGYGHRRPEGPAGTIGVQGAVIHSDARGTVSELAFGRKALIQPHTSPNTTWFLVIEGGGFVLVGDETARVFAGQAILWPAGVVHGASTDVSEMRAIVVELAGADDHELRGILEGTPLPLPSGPAAKGEGALVDDRPVVYDPSHGEPA